MGAPWTWLDVTSQEHKATMRRKHLAHELSLHTSTGSIRSSSCYLRARVQLTNNFVCTILRVDEKKITLRVYLWTTFTSVLFTSSICQSLWIIFALEVWCLVIRKKIQLFIQRLSWLVHFVQILFRMFGHLSATHHIKKSPCVNQFHPVTVREIGK